MTRNCSWNTRAAVVAVDPSRVPGSKGMVSLLTSETSIRKGLIHLIFVHSFKHSNKEKVRRGWTKVNLSWSIPNFWILLKWAFQHPKMKVLYRIRPYFVGTFPYIPTYRPYIYIYRLGTSNWGSWNGHWLLGWQGSGSITTPPPGGRYQRIWHRSTPHPRWRRHGEDTLAWTQLEWRKVGSEQR